jgi:hypothetical protein
MNEKREREIERLKRMIDDAETGDPGPLYQAFRSSLALRPVPDELVQALAGRQRETLRLRAASNAPELANLARETIRQFTGPSDRARDPNSAVGSVAAAIKRVLPEFEEWTLDASEAAAQLLAFPGDRRDLLKGLMPPGFANGRPGAFLRATRALLIPGDGGVLRTAYELLEDSPDPETFRAGMQGVRVGDVLDLTWMAAGPLELRSVQELLERLIAAVLPGASSRFASYDEPRYRAALRLLLGDESARAATGGVLAVWQGSPDGVGAAHVRIYLEPWATVLSGKPVETAAPIP